MIGKTSIPVFNSRYQSSVLAKDVYLEIGERLLYKGKVEVAIDSDIMSHDECPNIGYECIFHDTGERAFVDSEGLEWLKEYKNESI